MKLLKISKNWAIGAAFEVDAQSVFLNPVLQLKKEVNRSISALKCLWIRWIVFGVLLTIVRLNKVVQATDKALQDKVTRPIKAAKAPAKASTKKVVKKATKK